MEILFAHVQEGWIPIWGLKWIFSPTFVLHIECIHEVLQMSHSLLVEEPAISTAGEKKLEIMIDFFVLDRFLIWLDVDERLPVFYRRILFGQVFVDGDRHIRGAVS